MTSKRLGFIFTAIGIVLSLVVGIVVYSQVSEAQRVQASLPTLRTAPGSLHSRAVRMGRSSASRRLGAKRSTPS